MVLASAGVRMLLWCAVALGAAAVVAACGDSEVERAHVDGDTTAAEAGSGGGVGLAPGARAGSADTQTVMLQMGEPIRKYGVGSAVVEYVNERLGRRQTLYFDHGGAEEAVYLDGAGDSIGVPFDVSIYTGTWRFDYSTKERTGIAKQQPNAPGAMLGLLPDMRGMTLTPLEPRTIAGMRATGVSYGERPTRVWMWKGIPLRIEQPIRGGADTLVLEAVSIRVDEKIPPERFQVPETVEISRLK